MAIKASYKTDEEIPEEVKSHYAKQTDGTFKLVLEGGLKTQADIDRVTKALDSERELRQDKEKELKKYANVDLQHYEKVKDIDPDKIGDGDDKTAEEIKKELQKEFRKLEDDLKAGFQNKEADLNAKVEAAEQKSKDFVVENFIRKSLAEQGFTDPRRVNQLMLEVKYGDDPEMKPMRDLIKSIEARAEEGTNKFTIIGSHVKDEQGAIDAIKSVADLEISKHFKPAADNSGGGAGGNNKDKNPNITGNPFKVGTDEYSVTKQQQILNTDKNKAIQLAKEAGWNEAMIDRF
jgi:hypothetical protein